MATQFLFMRFHIITLFPESFTSYTGVSMLKRGEEAKVLSFHFYNPRDFSDNRFRHIDKRPFGGGPGMVISAEPMLKAADAARKKCSKKKKPLAIFFSPGGKELTDVSAKAWAKYEDIILICGHYEGVDERVAKILKAKKVSIGPYTLTGGELPALVVMDAVSRQIKGVIGKMESLEGNRVASHAVYTRPETLMYKKKAYRVPKVLLSGDHKKIEEWKRKN